MGKLTTFSILVNGGDTVKAGTTLTGQVRLELRDDLELNEVRISFTGLSSTQWAEAQKSSPMPEMNTALMDPVVAQEVYFSHPLKLWPRESDPAETTSSSPQPSQSPSETRSTTTLTKGRHSMGFEFHVPDSAPNSFQGRNGFVLYHLKAVVEMPPSRGVRETAVTTRKVTVMSELDLNDVYEARESVHVTRDLKASKLLFPSVDCHATMRLTRKGFTQGEIIPVEFSVHNNSSHSIQNVSLLLKMIILYKAGDRRCESECVLAKSALGKVSAGKTLEGLDKRLRVPVTCQPTGLPGCSLINIKYRLELKVKPTSLSFKRLKLHSDVIVGTTPLASTSFHDSPPDYWSCCLPTYEEIMAFAPPPYTPQTSPTHALSPPALTAAQPEVTVTPHSSYLPPTADSLLRSTTGVPETVLRQNIFPAVCGDWAPSVMMPVEEFGLV